MIMAEVGIVRLAYSFIKAVVKPFWNITFGPIVKRSHRLYLTERNKVRWVTLSHDLSYCLRRSSEMSNDPNPVSTLLVRNDGDIVVDRLEICVMAENGNLTYPDVIVIPFLEPGKVANVRVNNIPVEAM